MIRVLTKEWWEERFLRMYDSWRDPVSWKVRATPKAPDSLREFRGKFALLVTFRRNGESVPSAMWYGLHNGRAYLRTGVDSPKVRRMRNNPNVLFCPSNIRGKPTGAVLECVARILPDEDKPWAAEIITEAYGVGRKVYDRTVATVYEEAAYIEITPMALVRAEREAAEAKQAAENAEAEPGRQVAERSGE